MKLIKLLKHLLWKIFDIIGAIIVIVLSYWWLIIPLALVVDWFFDEPDKKTPVPILTQSASVKHQNSVIPPPAEKIPTQTNTNYTYQKSWHDTGYGWAEDNDIDNFDDCQSEFGTSDEEDGCNEYVKENYTWYQTFGWYECTEDCSGHEAWYEWAEEHDISDSSDCESVDSSSFGEGCQTYVDENY